MNGVVRVHTEWDYHRYGEFRIDGKHVFVQQKGGPTSSPPTLQLCVESASSRLATVTLTVSDANALVDALSQWIGDAKAAEEAA